MWLLFSEEGLQILAFPCNNFGGQEPGTNQEILDFANSKDATFPLFGKLECEHADSEKTHPIYRYLRGKFGGASLKWNFAKFLCDANGIPVSKYSPWEPFSKIEADIVQLLRKK